MFLDNENRLETEMDDMERYGDYNEVDEVPGKNPVLTFIKTVAVVLIFAVVGLIAFRLFTFNYYPKAMKSIYFTEALTEHYRNTGGDIGAKTQKLRAQYDDPDDGNFFCDHLVVIPDIGEIQITLRYNNALEEMLAEERGDGELLPEDFSFRLWRYDVANEESVCVTGELVASEWDSFLMYRYARLVFDGVDLGGEDDPTQWIRLEIFVDGANKGKPYMVCIYENHELYSSFSDYELSSGEVPK